VLSAGTEVVSSGSLATATTVLSGGFQWVSAGGVASATTVVSGGLQVVSAGGTTVSTTLSGSGGIASSGQVAAQETVLSGGTASATTVSGGGRLTISSGGIASGAILSSGGLEVLSSGAVASATTVLGGAREIVSAGGIAFGTVLSSGGLELLSSGGAASGTTVLAGGFEDVISGGSTTSTTLIGSGAVSAVENVGGIFNGVAQPGGTASATTVSSGGQLIVSSGGSESGSVILIGGTEIVFLSGTAADTTVTSGGILIVSSGGIASGTVVDSGGSEKVSSGGTASAPTISGSGALLDLLSGAIVSGGITFSGSGGELQIGGSAAPSNTISGFKGVGDVIDLTGLTFSGNTSVGFDSATDVLTVTEGAISATIQLDSESYSGITWVAAQDSGSGTAVTAACFLRGTLIWTERGEVPVEDLEIGDEVVILSGAARAIKWIGRRAYDGRFVTDNRAVLPIRIEAGALADGVPARDLWVSPEHALYIDGVLVPASLLVNGATIRQVERIDRLEYFHIELAAHEVILAEGAPAESYVDCDNRFMFLNGGEFATLYPGDTPTPWQFCAPRVEPGSAELSAIRAALRERTEALGDRLTDDPDLHLIIDGEIIRAHVIDGEVYRFTIPAGSGAIWFASRSAVPAEAKALSQDQRRLGVAIERIVLRDDDLRTEIGYGHASLRDGFHEDEGGHRWTDGMARLPEELLRPFGGEVTIELHLIKPGLRYPLATPVPAAAAA